jgi:muconolactone delta-isomerase
LGDDGDESPVDVAHTYDTFREIDAAVTQEAFVSSITITATNQLARHLEQNSQPGDWDRAAYDMLVGRFTKVGEISHHTDDGVVTRPLWKKVQVGEEPVYIVPLVDGWYVTTDPDPARIEAVSIKDQQVEDEVKIVSWGGFTYGKSGGISCAFFPKALHVPPESARREWAYVVEVTSVYADRMYAEKMEELKALKARDSAHREDLGPISKAWISKGGWMARFVPLAFFTVTDDVDNAKAYVEELRAGIPVFAKELATYTSFGVVGTICWLFSRIGTTKAIIVARISQH